MAGSTFSVEIPSLLNTGSRTFHSVATNLPEGYSIAVGDFDGDGMDDLVLNDGGDVFLIYYSKGEGTFYQATELGIGDGAQAGAFEVGDLTGTAGSTSQSQYTQAMK